MTKIQLQTEIKENVSTRETCRVCGQGNMQPVLTLGEHSVSTFVTNMDEEAVIAPLELVLCDSGAGGGGLLQLKHTVDNEVMYRNYWYRSGLTRR